MHNGASITHTHSKPTQTTRIKGGDCYRQEISGLCRASTKRAAASYMGQRLRHRTVALLRASCIAPAVQGAPARAVLCLAGSNRHTAALGAQDRGHSAATIGRQGAARGEYLRQGNHHHRHVLGGNQQRTRVSGGASARESRPFPSSRRRRSRRKNQVDQPLIPFSAEPKAV